MNTRAVSANGAIMCCSEREVTVLGHLLWTFLQMSKQLTLDSFDAKLFTIEID